MPAWAPLISDSFYGFYQRNNSDKKSGDLEKICQIIEENTNADTPISVYGNNDIFYILSDRPHATQYSYQFPISNFMPEIMDKYFEQLEEQLPKVIVVPPSYCDDRIKQFLMVNDYMLIQWEDESMPDGWQLYKHDIKYS